MAESNVNHEASTCSQKPPLDEATYLRHVGQIQHHYSKGMARSKSALMSLMAETSGNRREWITGERPTIVAVTEKFPPLKEYDMVCM